MALPHKLPEFGASRSALLMSGRPVHCTIVVSEGSKLVSVRHSMVVRTAWKFCRNRWHAARVERNWRVWAQVGRSVGDWAFQRGGGRWRK